MTRQRAPSAPHAPELAQWCEGQNVPPQVAWRWCVPSSGCLRHVSSRQPWNRRRPQPWAGAAPSGSRQPRGSGRGMQRARGNPRREWAGARRPPVRGRRAPYRAPSGRRGAGRVRSGPGGSASCRPAGGRNAPSSAPGTRPWARACARRVRSATCLIASATRRPPFAPVISAGLPVRMGWSIRSRSPCGAGALRRGADGAGVSVARDGRLCGRGRQPRVRALPGASRGGGPEARADGSPRAP
jgi:hypothetical protein